VPFVESGKDGHVGLTTGQKVAFNMISVVHTIGAIGDIAGVFATALRMRKLLAAYGMFLWGHLAAQVVVGGFFIYELFQKDKKLIGTCSAQVSTRCMRGGDVKLNLHLLRLTGSTA
jgi:hypothetical protein